jgi:hypothetical protein
MRELTLPGPLADESFRRWEAERGDWQTTLEHGEPVLSLPDNRTPDWRRGTVAIAGDLAWGTTSSRWR